MKFKEPVVLIPRSTVSPSPELVRLLRALRARKSSSTREDSAPPTVD